MIELSDFKNTLPTPSDDRIDVRDVIAWVEECEEFRANANGDPDKFLSEDTEEVYRSLRALLYALAGKGGDELWRDVWYPVMLIREDDFKDYAQELADDIGAIPKDAGWPTRCIDWDQAAAELRTDYSAVEFDGVAFLYW